MIYRTLQPHELDAWYAHCHSVFRNDPPGYFSRHYTGDPDADAELIFVAVDGDRIVSTVRVFQRRIWLHGRAVPMGGIGEVSTAPDYRRRGIAADLLQMAIAAMEARGMPVSILFGDQRIYEAAGWRFCPVRFTEAEITELPTLSKEAAIRAFSADDLPTLMGIYDLYAGRMDGAVLRSEAYWRQWVLPQWREPYVLLVDQRPAAYCCAHVKDAGQGRALRVDELCAAPQAESLLPGFIRQVASMEEASSMRVFASLLPGISGKDYTSPQGMMVRLNLPMDEIRDSQALSASMVHAGMFPVDGF